jgi:hypothetical protein
VLAAEVSASSPDFGHLQPMVQATKKELHYTGVGTGIITGCCVKAPTLE